jgi:hypothetical protein
MRLLTFLALLQVVVSYHSELSNSLFYKSLLRPVSISRTPLSTSLLSSNPSLPDREISQDVSSQYERLIGSEFKSIEEKGVDYEIRNGKKYKLIKPAVRSQVMKSFYNLRLQLLSDNIYAFAIGVCLCWEVGSVKDVFSYGVGGVLGILYAFLLGRYVADLGQDGKASGTGNIRFVPVILLIALYGKFKGDINILPELAGFFTYKVAPIVRIFDTSNDVSDEAE